MWLAALGAVALVPFGLSDLLSGDPGLGSAMLVFAAALAFGVWLLRRGAYRPWLVSVVFGVPATVFNTTAVDRFGTFVTYWAFVVAIAFYLVLPLRWAVVHGAVFAVAVGASAWHSLGQDVASRFVVCLVLVSAFGAVAVRLVDDRERRLVDLMVHDPLTGLRNRQTLRSELSAAVAQSSPERPASILVIDVDHFKTINDSFGHPAGDRVLRSLAELVAREVRGEEMLARVGGEEFAVLLPETDALGATATAERLRSAVAAEGFEGVGAVTVSLGVDSLQRGDEPEDLMRRADEALYAAKAAGRNTVSQWGGPG